MRTSEDKQVKIPAASGWPIDGALSRLLARGLHHETQGAFTGASMLASNSSPYLRMAAAIARSHHERWDGSGYPDELAGEAIPPAARITRLCDAYDMLRSYRPYKREADHDAVVRAILSGNSKSRPRYFDPAVLAAFELGHEAFRKIFATVRE